MQSHPPSWVFPVETHEDSLHSQFTDGHSNEGSHPCDEGLDNMAQKAQEVGQPRSESFLTPSNELATWTSSTRPIEIEIDSLGSKNCFQQGLIRQAQQVLESALVNATQTLPLSKMGVALDSERVEPSELVSPEFLTWMLQGKNIIRVFEKSNKRTKLTYADLMNRYWEYEVWVVCLGLFQTRFKADLEAYGLELVIKSGINRRKGYLYSMFECRCSQVLGHHSCKRGA